MLLGERMENLEKLIAYHDTMHWKTNINKIFKKK